MIKEIPPKNWDKIKPIFDETFDSDLPDAKTAKIIGYYEDGKLKGFVLAERVLFIGQIYVAPEEREKNGGKIARSMIRYVRENTPREVSVAAVASESRFELLFKALGLQKIAGTLFRRG